MGTDDHMTSTTSQVSPDLPGCPRNGLIISLSPLSPSGPQNCQGQLSPREGRGGRGEAADSGQEGKSTIQTPGGRAGGHQGAWGQGWWAGGIGRKS